jgi:transcriptional regulator with XRE-family HTH domain
MSQEFAESIKKLRAVMGWTQRELAAKAGVSIATISQAERGRDISRKSIRRLSSIIKRHRSLIESGENCADPELVAKAIKDFVAELKESEAHVAELLGLHQETFYRLMSGGKTRVQTRSNVLKAINRTRRVNNAFDAAIDSHERAGLKLSDEGKDQLRRQIKDKCLNPIDNTGQTEFINVKRELKQEREARIEAEEECERLRERLSDVGNELLRERELRMDAEHRSQDSVEMDDLRGQVKALSSEIEDAKEATRRVSQDPIGLIVVSMMNQVAAPADGGLTINEARMMLAYAKSLTVMFEAMLESEGSESNGCR